MMICEQIVDKFRQIRAHQFALLNSFKYCYCHKLWG